MFQKLSEGLVGTLRKLKSQSRITEKQLDEALKKIRLCLLEADVNFKVAKTFMQRVREGALGQEVLKNISPGDQIVKIVHDELVKTLGQREDKGFQLSFKKKPCVIFMVGLQGVGKTTSSVKLAFYISEKLSRKSALLSVDVNRPAAIEQLNTLAKAHHFAFYPSDKKDKPVKLLKKAIKWAVKEQVDVLIVDTAGRLQVDKELMKEIETLSKVASPEKTFLVADAMLGQQSVNVAEGFQKSIPLTGIVLTKVDGDARGGAALSLKEVTGVPIEFLGVGEKVKALEVFHPERLASRILDQGDVVSLVEKAQEVISEEEASVMAKKAKKKGGFDLEDFLKQIQMMKKMGGFSSVLKMLPGAGQMMKKLNSLNPSDKEVKKIEAIIRSMTPQERRFPKVLNGSRRKRIALGSGTEVRDVNQLIRRFEGAQKMLSQVFKNKGAFPF